MKIFSKIIRVLFGLQILSLWAGSAMAGSDLGFRGDLVEPDCGAMSSWYNCRDITTVDPNDPQGASILRGAEYMHNTAATLGPFGNVRYPDGSPYATATTACSSCHFTAGHVPFGTPVYQSPSKYVPLPLFAPLGYKRDLEDSIIDCFRNCMNAERSPSKDDPVMRDLVAYTNWVADGIIDPAMRANWLLLPPEAGPNLPSLDPTIYTSNAFQADPNSGQALYAAQCAECHDMDPDDLDRAGLTPADGPNGLGQGEYRIGDDRPAVPALWGLRDGHSTAAAFYRNGVLGAYIQTHMPFETPNTLTDQEALDIAAYINAPDKDDQRLKGQADRFFCFNAANGLPAALGKVADWLVGCEYRNENNQAEPFSEDQIRKGPWGVITAWRAAERARRLASNPAPVAVSDPPSQDLDGADAITTPQGTAKTLNVLANDVPPTSGGQVSLVEVTRIFPPTATVDFGPDGSATYTPPAGYSGEGGFVYRSQDSIGLWSNFATVLIAVGGETPPPPVVPVDLSIQEFQATSNVRLSRNQSVAFQVEDVHEGIDEPHDVVLGDQLV